MPAHANAVRVSAAGTVLRGPLAAAVASGNPPSSLVTWYLGLMPHWMGATPRLKRCLLLRTHQWIIERVLAPEASIAVAAGELRPHGALARILSELIPATGADPWHRFAQLMVARLRDALLLPVTRRNEAWVRWLFLVPSGIPAPLQTADARPHPSSASTRSRPASKSSAVRSLGRTGTPASRHARTSGVAP